MVPQPPRVPVTAGLASLSGEAGSLGHTRWLAADGQTGGTGGDQARDFNYAALQPDGTVLFDTATAALGLTAARKAAKKADLAAQAAAAGCASGLSTDATYSSKDVTVQAVTPHTVLPAPTG